MNKIYDLDGSPKQLVLEVLKRRLWAIREAGKSTPLDRLLVG